MDWAALGERCRLWTFLAKFECIIIDDWQVDGCCVCPMPNPLRRCTALYVYGHS